MRTEYLIHAAALLENVTPLKTDCGEYCGGACCKTDEDGQGGVYLFPGEAASIEPVSWGRIVPSDALGGCDMLLCDGACDRVRRPIGCRLFPLTPALNKDGSWSVRMDRRGWAVCPLMEHGIRGMDPAFVQNAKEAVSLLAQDPELESFLRRWMRLERAFAAQRSL